MMIATRRSEPELRLDSTVSERRAVVLGVVAALLVGLTLRVVAISGKRLVSHDEAISYLVATGHQDEYHRIVREEVPPYGVWANAREWKRLSELEEWFCFSAIRDGLSNCDIHPPLYFWLLHLWCLMFGVHEWTGPTLNLLIFSVTAIALFGYGREVLREPRSAAAVVFLWVVSPAVLASTWEARQYELLTMWTVLTVWMVDRETATDSRTGTWGLFRLVLVTAGGLLTHFRFGLILLTCGVFALWRVRRGPARPLARVGAAVACGGVLFVLACPGFWNSVERSAGRVGRTGQLPLDQRVERVEWTYTSPLVDPGEVPQSWRPTVSYVVLAVILLAVVVVLIGAWRARRVRNGGRNQCATILYFLICGAGWNVVLFLLSVTPSHAMDSKYACMVWPFAAFLPVLPFRSLRSGRGVLVGFVCLGLLVTGGLRATRYRRENEPMADELHRWNSAKRLLIDNVGSGRLPAITKFIPDDAVVFAARVSDLIELHDQWLEELSTGDIWVNSHNTSNEGQLRLVRLLATRFRRCEEPYYVGHGTAFCVLNER